MCKTMYIVHRLAAVIENCGNGGLRHSNASVTETLDPAKFYFPVKFH